MKSARSILFLFTISATFAGFAIASPPAPILYPSEVQVAKRTIQTLRAGEEADPHAYFADRDPDTSGITNSSPILSWARVRCVASLPTKGRKQRPVRSETDHAADGTEFTRLLLEPGESVALQNVFYLCEAR